jgi:hypothetical protein
MHPMLNVYLAESIRTKGPRRDERSYLPSSAQLRGRRTRKSR